MKILVLCTAKTKEKYLKTALDSYLKRLANYKPEIKYAELPIPKKVYTYSDFRKIKEAEADIQLHQINSEDFLTLLDDKGKSYTSEQFAERFSSMLISSHRRWVFLIGGPYGFDQTLYQRANELLSLSKMTFSHQMVRLILLEQIYRAQSILHNQSYHHK